MTVARIHYNYKWCAYTLKVQLLATVNIFLVNVVFAHVFLMMLDIHASTHFTSLFQLTSCFGAGELRRAAIKANIAQIRL